MKRIAVCLLPLVLLLATCGVRASNVAPMEKAIVTVDWAKVTGVSSATATVQLVLSPLMTRSAPQHDQFFQALRDLGCDYVRLQPWVPYPKLAVAELDPPHNGKTSWDFSVIDPYVADFMQAMQGHSTIWDFSTIPQWMFKTPKPVSYPSDPNEITWHYSEGTELRDPSMKEVVDYYTRLVSWYTQGGVSDEFGKWHESGHHYKIDYWEVLNEVDGSFEHHMSAQEYTSFYDAVVTAIRKVDPRIKFVGLALADPSSHPEYFEYFLNHKNHKPGIPLDMISYHWYASPALDQRPEDWANTFFTKANGFLNVVRYIQATRERLSPETQTTLDELGSVSADEGKLLWLRILGPAHRVPPVPDAYWNLAGALYAYLYGELTTLGIQGVGVSDLGHSLDLGLTTSSFDVTTGRPNARYWVLKLLHENFGPGDKVAQAGVSGANVYARGFIGSAGQRKVLLVNLRNRPFEVSLEGGAGATLESVDQVTDSHPAAKTHLMGNTFILPGFAVGVVSLGIH